jgi:hypothetical protein
MPCEWPPPTHPVCGWTEGSQPTIVDKLLDGYECCLLKDDPPGSGIDHREVDGTERELGVAEAGLAAREEDTVPRRPHVGRHVRTHAGLSSRLELLSFGTKLDSISCALDIGYDEYEVFCGAEKRETCLLTFSSGIWSILIF